MADKHGQSFKYLFYEIIQLLQVHRIDNQISADTCAKLNSHNYASSNSFTPHFIGDLLENQKKKKENEKENEDKMNTEKSMLGINV